MNNTLSPDPLIPPIASPSPLSTTKFDLLWRNRQPGSSGFGENYLWTMQDAVQTNSTRLFPVADAAWQIVGTADANRDGIGDILWRNSDNGINVWWYMDAQGQIAQSALIQSVEDKNWKIVGVGDQDRDGQVDILWRNLATGDNIWWLMQGTTIKAGKAITSLAPANNDWEIKGLGDVNQDGQIDIFWSNRTTRQMVWWVMDGVNNSSSSFAIEADASGAIAIGTADFNADASPDIVLRNRQTGANTLLLMDRATVLDRYTIAPVDANWDIAGLVPRVETMRSTSIGAALTDPAKPAPIAPNASARFFVRDQVSAQLPDRLYAFNVSESGLFTANLTGLTADGDVRLIQDTNGNGLIDAGE
jgi:FG-GAP-like repeat